MRRPWLPVLASLALALPATTLSQPAPPDPCDFGEVVLFATNSIHINTGANVTGDVVGNFASAGPVLEEGAELALDRNSVVTGDLFADTIDLDRDSTVNGDLLYNEIFDGGATINGTGATPLPLPVYADFPVFREATVRPEADDVTVGPGQTVSLDEGDYGDILVDATGTLIFTGGLYNIRSIGSLATIGGQCLFPCRSILFAAPTELRIEGRLHAPRNSKIGPTTSATIGGEGISVYVGGINGADGALLSLPRAAYIEQKSEVVANFYVGNGTFRIDRDSTLKGAVLARDINIQRDVTVTRASAFSNQPPTAFAQDLSASGPITVTLEASDPENDDLTFEIVSGPEVGTLGPVVQDPPPFPGDPPGCNPANIPGCIPPDPPRTSATVTYTPPATCPPTNLNPDGTCQDEFVFKAIDECGNSSEAKVRVNPPPDPSDPGEQVDIEAFDALIDVVKNTPTLVSLNAATPEGVTAVDFIITSLPANGALSDGGTSIETTPFTLAGNTVTFTPASGFTGVTSFDFRAQAQGEICVLTPSPECDDGTITLDVDDQAELAPNSSATTGLNTPVQITLFANAGGSGSQSLSASATGNVHAGGAPLPGATIAGNVSDAPPYDGLGDGRDDLPGPAPVLIAAGVDVNLGSAPSGAVSDPAGDATNDSRDDPANPDLVSATVSSDGTNLNLSVRFVQAGFSSATSRGSFVLDIDENPATGFPGVDAANNDSALMGVEFLVNIGANLGASADVLKFVSLPNNFNNVGNFPATVLADGYDVSIPLSILDGDDGRMTFKAETQSHLGGGGFTGILDYMPDLGLAPGQAKAGIFGTARIEIEWDISQLPVADEIESAIVTLHTEKGTVDDLDTVFFFGTAEQNGLLDVSDYEAQVSPLPGIVMPVPAGPTGTKGTFQFDVTQALRSALDSGFDYFSIQGRVDGEEDLVGGGFRRGLQVRSTATGNLNAGNEPQLEVITTTTPQEPPLLWTVRAPLPANGTLKTLAGAAVNVGTTFTLQPTLLYTPNFNFSGTDFVNYQVDQGLVFDTAVIDIFVDVTDDCIFNGRDPGCTPSSPLQGGGSSSAASQEDAFQGDPLQGPSLTVSVEGPGSVASNPMRRVGGRVLGVLCSRAECVTKFAEGTDVALLARPADGESAFEGWRGDCSGEDPVATVTMTGDRACVAVFRALEPARRR